MTKTASISTKKPASTQTIPDHPILVAGRWEKSGKTLEVLSPYTQKLIGTTYSAGEKELEKSVSALEKSFAKTKKLSSFEKSLILSKIARSIESHKEEIARIIALEAGKPLKDSLREAERAVLTFQTASEEAKRFYGQTIPLDLAPGAEGREGIVKRFPLGPVLAITPFNFPLNLAAHKLAPSIAVGNPILIKVPAKTPLTMLTVARWVLEAGWPPEALSVFPMQSSLYDKLVADERFKILTFTGSSSVGWSLKAKAGKKRVLLELGGNAGAILDRDTPIEYAAQRVAVGAFSFAGQSCISVQRVYVHKDIRKEFEAALIRKVAALKTGDPLNPQTDVGPMIDPGALKQTQEWVDQSVREGARLLCGGKIRGNVFEPTILADVKNTSPASCEEAFAPILCLNSFTEFEEALEEVNRSRYGLQAGVFTKNLEHAFEAYERIEAGGVILNDVPTWRMDPMPYGGVKDSGLGREGIRYSMEEMSEPKLLVISPLPKG